MKNNLMRVLSIVGLCLMTGVIAFASVKKENIMLRSNVTVNGTVVKAGTYEVEFDSVKNEITFFKNHKVIVKATAHTKKESGKADSTRVETLLTDNAEVLTGIIFRGKDQHIILGDMKADTTSMK